MINNVQLTEHRCSCGKLLFKGLLVLSIVEIKCKHCGKLVRFDEEGELARNVRLTRALKNYPGHFGIV